MSYPYRCIPCHRSGDPDPPFSSIRWHSPEATARQRLNALSCHLLDTIPEHVATTGHNEWEEMDVSGGGWKRLGAYMGDGWFEEQWNARPWWERRTPEIAAKVKAWERAKDPLPDGDHCLVCDWHVPPGSRACAHIARTGHNEWGTVRGSVRYLNGPLISCGDGCEPPAGPVSEMWERVHS